MGKRAKPKTPRRVFDRAITVAVYRWEFLRRNPEYGRDVQSWIDRNAKTFLRRGRPLEGVDEYIDHVMANGGVIDAPFGAEGGVRYDADCKKWGLRILLHPDVTVDEVGMAAWPVFADTPRRQHTVKDIAAGKRRVMRMPDHSLGRPPGSARDLLEELNREDHERVEGGERPEGPDISDRDLRRYFRFEKVPPSGVQLRSQRKHLPKFDRYLKVFDLHEKEKKPLYVIAKALNQSPKEARRIYDVARSLIGLPKIAQRVIPTAVKTEEAPEGHFPCTDCERLDTPCQALEALLPQDSWLRESLPGDVEGSEAKQLRRARGWRVAPKGSRKFEELDLRDAALRSGLSRKPFPK